MAAQRPPQPPPGFPVTTVSSPNIPTPRPERRPTPPAFSSPVETRFSPQRPEKDSLPSSPNGIQTGSPVPQYGTPPVPQFNAPLGPPIFSSPLRPAAVPFPASRASPQPVAFSSHSSLPTSSLPLYSNGSDELQPQAYAASDESVLNATSQCVLFSAHKVPYLCFHNSIFVVHNFPLIYIYIYMLEGREEKLEFKKNIEWMRIND